MYSVRKGVLRNFAKFAGKHLCQSLFFKKVALAQVFPCEFSEISKNTFFTEHLRATASDPNEVKNCKKQFNPGAQPYIIFVYNIVSFCIKSKRIYNSVCRHYYGQPCRLTVSLGHLHLLAKMLPPFVFSYLFNISWH